MEARSTFWRNAGWTLFILWALVFLGGALGELFDIEFLRDNLDLKRIFLR